MSKRVAVVTGSNKGIGFGIVRALCKQFDGDVFLTSRDVTRGQEAIQTLEKEGLKPKFHQLDISDPNSVVQLRDFLKQNYQGLDVLVNNAAIAYKAKDPAPFSEQAKVTIQINFYDTLNVCKELFPLLRPHARVAHVSSFVSPWALAKCSEAVRAQFTDPKLTMPQLEALMQKFVDLAQENKHKEDGFPDSAYGMSKVAVTAMTVVQQREFDAKGAQDIVVNAADPGHVNTDMSSHSGKLTIDQGAETPVYAALLPPSVTSPRGELLTNKKIVPFDTTK